LGGGVTRNGCNGVVIRSSFEPPQRPGLPSPFYGLTVSLEDVLLRAWEQKGGQRSAGHSRILRGRRLASRAAEVDIPLLPHSPLLSFGASHGLWGRVRGVVVGFFVWVAAKISPEPKGYLVKIFSKKRNAEMDARLIIRDASHSTMTNYCEVSKVSFQSIFPTRAMLAPTPVTRR